MRLATQYRVLVSATRDIADTEERAQAAWVAVDRLSVCPSGCIAMNRAALLEMRDKINAMLGEVQ